MKSVLLGLLVIVIGGSTWAEEAADHQDGPCKKVMDACKEAASNAKAANGKMNIYKDCFQLLMKDQTVAGVSIDKGDISACQAKREAHKKGK